MRETPLGGPLCPRLDGRALALVSLEIQPLDRQSIECVRPVVRRTVVDHKHRRAGLQRLFGHPPQGGTVIESGQNNQCAHDPVGILSASNSRIFQNGNPKNGLRERGSSPALTQTVSYHGVSEARLANKNGS
jgi:hypothetical protein